MPIYVDMDNLIAYMLTLFYTGGPTTTPSQASSGTKDPTTGMPSVIAVTE